MHFELPRIVKVEHCKEGNVSFTQSSLQLFLS